MNYILLTSKPWHDDLFRNLAARANENWFRISSEKDFHVKKLDEIQPEKIFIPHWSQIIPSEVFDNFECIVFHMTDLPYGRGGSPLQNLIVRGHVDTQISAIKVSEGIDTGDVYLKAPLSLFGTAEEIFTRGAGVIEKMINTIIQLNPMPISQEGEPVIFSRRKPEQGNVAELKELSEVFDYIRMLDCEGYPKAFLETEYLRMEFSRASLKANKSILSDVRIFKK